LGGDEPKIVLSALTLPLLIAPEELEPQGYEWAYPPVGARPFRVNNCIG
jgi:hypothetical protein